MTPSDSLQIVVNGKTRSFTAPLSVQQLLETLGFLHPHLAVAVNDRIIPRSLQAKAQLQAGDRVEIIRAVGGG